MGLEQWADGLGRITKKTAYLDTILHNNQMTHKKLWAEAGEAVHQVGLAGERGGWGWELPTGHRLD